MGILATASTTGRRRQRLRVLSAVALIASGVLLLSTLLPWLRLTFIVSLSVRGLDTTEGTVCFAAAVIGAALAVLAMVQGRPAVLIGAAIAGVVALIAQVVLAFRLDEAFHDNLAGQSGDEVRDLVGQVVSLDVGWVLALIAALVMVLAGIYEPSAAGVRDRLRR
ncbi:hypothetical protein [Actinomadura sp. 9N407]|uniref:hypothetical protein n=1 Tax=Actinomadura sp. 9N407 TaxID=3375154 RepID=UPI0037B956AC